MFDPPVNDQRPPLHWPSLLQFIFSLLAVLLAAGMAVLLAVVSLTDIFSGAASLADSGGALMAPAGLLFGSLLILPSAFFALARLAHWDIHLPPWMEKVLWPFTHPWVLMLLVPLILLAGYFVTKTPDLSLFLLPPIHVLVVGISLLFLVYLAARKLNGGSPQRLWGALAAGLGIGPTIAIFLEIGALFLFGVGAIVYVALNPALQQELETLAMRLALVAQSEELLVQALIPYLTRPAVILAILSFVSVAVPMIEEAVKPAAVWLLAGRNLSPREGFVLGVISGAGFALYENLSIALAGQEWVVLATARIGSALLHIFTTGLTGWALAKSWRERRYIVFVLGYVTAVIIHGLWNAGAILSGIWSLRFEGYTVDGAIGGLLSIAPFALGFLAAVLFILLLVWNRRLRETGKPQNWGENGSSVTTG